MDWSITPDFLKFCPQFVDSVFIKLSSNYSFECVTYFMPQPYDIPVLCSHIIAMIDPDDLGQGDRVQFLVGKCIYFLGKDVRMHNGERF